MISPLGIAVLEHALEFDDARIGVAQIDLAFVAVQGLQVLDRVPGRAHSHALPDHPIQVHEHPIAQQLVELLLARRVPAGEDLEVAGLVRAVVVDVHARVLLPALREQVHDLLERVLLSLPT